VEKIWVPEKGADSQQCYSISPHDEMRIKPSEFVKYVK